MPTESPSTAATDNTDLLRRIEAHLAAIREAQGAATRDWLTVHEVAQELRVSRDTIERLIASGDLQAVSIRTPTGRGRRNRYRVKREWVEQYLMAQCDRLQKRRRSRAPYGGPDFVG